MIDFSKINIRTAKSKSFEYSQNEYPENITVAEVSELYWKFEDKYLWLNPRGEFDPGTLPKDSLTSFFIPAFFDFCFGCLIVNVKTSSIPENIKGYFKYYYATEDDIIKQIDSLHHDMIFSYNHYLAIQGEIVDHNIEKVNTLNKIQKAYLVFEKSFYKLIHDNKLLFQGDSNIYQRLLNVIFSFKAKMRKDISVFAIKSFTDAISEVNSYLPFSVFANPLRFFKLLVDGFFIDHDYFEYIRSPSDFKLEIDYQVYVSLDLIFTNPPSHLQISDYYTEIKQTLERLETKKISETIYVRLALEHIQRIVQLYESLLPNKVKVEQIRELKEKYIYISSLVNLPISDKISSVFYIKNRFDIFETKILLLKFFLGGTIEPGDFSFRLYNDKKEGAIFINTIVKRDSVFSNKSFADIENSQLFFLDDTKFKDSTVRKQINRIEYYGSKFNEEFNNRLLKTIKAY